MEIYLASASPRRREILGWMGLSFKSLAADTDETPHDSEAPAQYVTRLAHDKALAVAKIAGDIEALYIGADTTVADGNTLLGKPGNVDEARRMLTQLRGRIHQVYTGFAIYAPGLSAKPVGGVAVSDVPMRRYSPDEIEAYIASGDPFDKAGAYAIQHSGFNPVPDFKGCFANVMGFPLCHLGSALRRLGVPVPAETPNICQKNLAYSCPVFKSYWQT